MRIKTNETLETPDVEGVLSVLERTLREISAEVVRQGTQITLRGLGPSQRTMNRHDVTVIDVQRENSRTVIHADITYQASALMGDISQDEIVSAKLERVFESVKMELRAKRVRIAVGTTVPEQPAVREHVPPAEPEGGIKGQTKEFARGLVSARTAAPESFAAAAPAIHAAAASRVPAADVAREAEVQGETTVVHEGAAGDAVASRYEATVAAGAVEGGFSDKTAVVHNESEPASTLSSIPAALDSRALQERGEVDLFQTVRRQGSKPPRSWGFGTAVACVIAAVLIFLAWPHIAGLIYKDTSSSSGSVDVQPVRSSAEKANAHDSDPVVTQDALGQNEANPERWLESWATAMRTEDASAQASFYADPVDRYFLKSNVSNADVWLDKQIAIRKRNGPWTVKLQDIVIEEKPEGRVGVRLVKHIVSKPRGESLSERFIRSQLVLKLVDGQWKIVSERDFR